MQNTFSQAGNDSKWFSKKIIFLNRYVELEAPPFIEKTILNFHFDYLHPPLILLLVKKNVKSCQLESKIGSDDNDSIGSKVDVTIMMKHKATVNAVSITP